MNERRRLLFIVACLSFGCAKRNDTPPTPSANPEERASLDLSPGGGEWAGYTIMASKGSTVTAEGGQVHLHDPRSPNFDVMLSRQRQDVSSVKAEQVKTAQIYGAQTKFHEQAQFFWTREEPDAFEWYRINSKAPDVKLEGFRRGLKVGDAELWCWSVVEGPAATVGKLRETCESLTKK